MVLADAFLGRAICPSALIVKFTVAALAELMNPSSWGFAVGECFFTGLWSGWKMSDWFAKIEKSVSHVMPATAAAWRKASESLRLT